jgi:hypothetical protein
MRCLYIEHYTAHLTHRWHTQEFCLGRGGGVSTNSVEDRGQTEWGSGGVQGFRSICKWVKPVFLLGCYRCNFHGTGNSAQLCQNFGLSGGGGFKKFCSGQRAERMGIWGWSWGFCSICKWVKPILLLGCYGRIFHGTGNSSSALSKLWTVLGGGGGGGCFNTPNNPPPAGGPWPPLLTLKTKIV